MGGCLEKSMPRIASTGILMIDYLYFSLLDLVNNHLNECSYKYKDI